MAIETFYDSKALTVDEAIAVIEQSCIDKLVEKIN